MFEKWNYIKVYSSRIYLRSGVSYTLWQPVRKVNT